MGSGAEGTDSGLFNTLIQHKAVPVNEGKSTTDTLNGLTKDNLNETLKAVNLPLHASPTILARIMVFEIGATPAEDRMLQVVPVLDLGLGVAHVLVLGRWPRCDVPIPNPYISRYHGVFSVEKTKSGFFVVIYKDVGTFKKGSTNGTLLNHATLLTNEAIPLGSEDILEIGYQDIGDGMPSHRFVIDLNPDET